MPKLVNKSIAFIIALVISIITSGWLLQTTMSAINATQFNIADPIFNMDVGFYMFILPFIKAVLIYLLVESLIMVIYTAIYYVITINVCFEKGVNMESLKKNTFIKQIKFWAIVFTLFICIYILVNAQDILTGDMLTIKNKAQTSLTGAGLSDTFIKLWGYRLFSF